MSFASSFLPRLAAASIMLISVLNLTGCWDRRELDELAIVLSMAIDAGEKDGDLLISYKIVNPAGGNQGDGGSDESSGAGQMQSFFILSGQGSSIVDANREIQLRLSRQLFFSQVQVILFGEALARQGVAPLLDHLERDGQLRRTMWIGVVEGEARQSLTSTAAAIEVSADVAATLDRGPKNGAITVLFGDFLERLSSPGAAPIATATKNTKHGAGLSGTAVFTKDRLIGFLDPAKTLGLGIALGEIEAGTVLVGSVPEIEEQIQQIQGKTNVQLENNQLHIHVIVEVKSSLEEQTGMGDFATPATWGTLEAVQADIVRGFIQSAFDQAQKWQTDIFRTGDLFARKYPKLWLEVVDDWSEVFSTATIEIEVRSEVTQGGLIKKRVPFR